MITGYIVNHFEEGLDLRKFLLSHLESLSQKEVESLLPYVRVNGENADSGLILHEKDVIGVSLSEALYKKAEQECSLSSPEGFSKALIYEDNNVLVINKPKGLLVQRNISYGPSAESYVREHLKDKKGLASPAHRLDRGTSGVLVFGKNAASLSALGKAFMNHETVKKNYLALVVGETPEAGTIDSPLAKDVKTGIVAVTPLEKGGKASFTSYKRLALYKGYSLLRVSIATGRTHQIRAHLLSIAHPIVGDGKYGQEKTNGSFEEKFSLEGPFLHSESICFLSLEEPLSYLEGKSFEAPLPRLEENILESLSKES